MRTALSVWIRLRCRRAALLFDDLGKDTMPVRVSIMIWRKPAPDYYSFLAVQLKCEPARVRL